jgi:hypothetical protein
MTLFFLFLAGATVTTFGSVTIAQRLLVAPKAHRFRLVLAALGLGLLSAVCWPLAINDVRPLDTVILVAVGVAELSTCWAVVWVFAVLAARRDSAPSVSDAPPDEPVSRWRRPLSPRALRVARIVRWVVTALLLVGAALVALQMYLVDREIRPVVVERYPGFSVQEVSPFMDNGYGRSGANYTLQYGAETSLWILAPFLRDAPGDPALRLEAEDVAPGWVTTELFFARLSADELRSFATAYAAVHPAADLVVGQAIDSQAPDLRVTLYIRTGAKGHREFLSNQREIWRRLNGEWQRYAVVSLSPGHRP